MLTTKVEKIELRPKANQKPIKYNNDMGGQLPSDYMIPEDIDHYIENYDAIIDKELESIIHEELLEASKNLESLNGCRIARVEASLDSQHEKHIVEIEAINQTNKNLLSIIKKRFIDYWMD